MQGVRIAVRVSVWTILFVGLVGLLQAFLPSARAMALDANIVMTANSPQRDEYNPVENITTGVSLNAGSMPRGVGYDGAYLEVEMPTMRYGEYTNTVSPGTRNVWPVTLGQDHLIDSGDSGFSAPIGGNIVSRSSRQENGKTYIRINFKRIDATVRASFPYVFSFADRVTPKGATLQPVYRLYTAGGELLAETRDKAYRATYGEYNFEKRTIRNQRSQNREVYAGAVTNGRVADDTKEVVPFYYIIEPSDVKLRLMQKAKITDTLPMYTNSKGQTVRAVFDPAQNPGWVDNSDGTVSYEHEENVNNFAYDSRGERDKAIAAVNRNVVLKLSFPGIQTHENGRQKEYTNSAKIELTPINRGANEPVSVYESSVKYRIKSQAGYGDLFAKDASDNIRGGIVHDNNAMALNEYSWTLHARNNTPYPMRNIVFTESVENMDPRLFLSSTSYTFFERYPTGLRVVEGIWMRAYKSDGSYDDIKGPKDGKLGNRVQVNTEATAALADTDQRIMDGALKQKEAPDVVPKYTKVEIHLPDGYELPVGNTLDFNIGTRFRNPFTVPYEVNKPVTNQARASATIMSEPTQNITSDDLRNQGTFVKRSERATFVKQCAGGANATVGTRFDCSITLRLGEASRARVYKKPKIVDILPNTVAIVDPRGNPIEPSVERSMGWPRNSPTPVKKEIVKNYKGTGRTAMIWEFPSGRLPSELQLAAVGAFGITQRSIPTQAQDLDDNNDNTAYFTYENDDASGFPEDLLSDQKVEDTLDVNDNGRTDDIVLRSSAKIAAVLPQEVRSQKQIRSTEQSGGANSQQNVWSDRASTNFAVKGEGTFEYRLKVSNFTTTGLTGLILYDVLPHKGDAKGSQFSAKMTGPAKISISGKDVSADYDVYYRTDMYPSDDPVKEKDDSRWTLTYPSDGNVTAVKVMPKAGKQVASYKVVNIDLPMVAPQLDRGLSGATTHNVFFVSYNNGKSFGGSNDVVHQLAEAVDFSGTKEWDDGNDADGVRPKEVTLKLFANGSEIKRQKATAEGKWSYDFGVLPKKDHGRDIEYRVEEDPVPGYQADIQGTTITNRHTPEKLTIQGEKKWEDDDNRDLAATGDDAYLFAGGGLMSVAAAVALLVIRVRRRSA